ncbi:MAG TPA: hypothetical protein DCM40_41990 [Maribacter sp.]|nr:hypothetical protein [Maribacter sp.]|tara:strand:+ start:499 stop:696 length:198 start_codon:yes stop_codon:yes gene_type:complete
MNSEATKFYLYGLEGEILLVEVAEFDGGVSLSIAGKRLDMESESAFDLADALMQVANLSELQDHD